MTENLNNKLPSGIHFIRKFKGRPNAYPGPIGEKGFINFDHYIKHINK